MNYWNDSRSFKDFKSSYLQRRSILSPVLASLGQASDSRRSSGNTYSRHQTRQPSQGISQNSNSSAWCVELSLLGDLAPNNMFSFLFLCTNDANIPPSTTITTQPVSWNRRNFISNRALGSAHQQEWQQLCPPWGESSSGTHKIRWCLINK